MLRYLLYVWLAFAGCVSANDGYLTVTGTGPTYEQAKQTAFRKAIEYKVGVLVVSDLEVKNRKVYKDEIYVYSSGYVNDYKVLKQETNDNNVTVLLEVNVNESKLKNRILSDGKSTSEFNGDKHQTQITTYQQERTQAVNLLQKVLDNYPSSFFNIKQSKYTIKLDYANNPSLEIPYVLSVNYDFVKSFKESLSYIQNCRPTFFTKCASMVRTHAKDPKAFLLGEKDEYFFNDIEIINLIHNNFVDSEPRIYIEFLDIKNEPLRYVCYTPKFVSGYSTGFFDNGSSNYIILYGNNTEESLISIPFKLELLDKVSKITTTIKSKKFCD